MRAQLRQVTASLEAQQLPIQVSVALAALERTKAVAQEQALVLQVALLEAASASPRVSQRLVPTRALPCSVKVEQAQREDSVHQILHLVEPVLGLL